ncbi:hypothetical protein HYV84_06810 [Candidatus Woesearchaeota archaeon]|nr:hypothetical protein [Candidatus Woesearchaeota archaeon]
MAKSLIVRSNLKYYAKYNDQQLFIGGDFPDRLNQKVIEIVQEASRRAKANQRNTVMSRDI